MEPLVQDNLLVGHSHNAVDREHAARLGRPLYSAERRAYTVPSSRYTLIRSLRRPQRELVPCQQCQALRAQDSEID